MHAFVHSITQLLNSLFGGPLTTLMMSMGIHPQTPGAPIADVLTLQLMVAFVLLAFFVVVRLTLNVERPNPVQSIAEMLLEFSNSQGEAIIGRGYEPHIPFVTTLFIFILLCNCIEGCCRVSETPTAHAFVPSRPGDADVSLLQATSTASVHRGRWATSSTSLARSGGYPHYCFRLRSSLTSPATCRSPFVSTPTCSPAICSPWSSFQYSR